jgi:hypothetical protein
VTPEGHGPAWATSLLEDNAQFGFGIYFGLKQRRLAYMAAARQLLGDADGPGSAELRAALQEWLQVGAHVVVGVGTCYADSSRLSGGFTV